MLQRHASLRRHGLFYFKGEKMKVKKEVTSINIGPPGTIHHFFGNKFIVQEDGSLVADVHPYTGECGIKAGWFVAVAEPEPGKKVTVEVETTVTTLGYDIGNYYGVGDLEKLREKITALRAAEMRDFARTRLRINLAPNAKSEKLIEMIMKHIIQEKQEDNV